MATKLRRILLLVIALVSICSCNAASVFHPVSGSHRSAALELFTPVDGSFGSLEETYEAFRVFKVLGIEKEPDLRKSACSSVSEVLGSSSSSLKDTFYALKVSSILGCNIKASSFKAIASRLKAITSDASSLHDFYYSVGGLVLLKDQASTVDVHLDNAAGIFRAIKAFSQSDGRWRYGPNNPESSTYASGMALEALAGVISLASSEFDQSMIDNAKKDVVKLFDNIEKYDDGSYYFDEKVDGHEYVGPLSTTASVIQGLTTFASVTPEKLNLPEDKVLGLARFLLGIGIPGDSKELFKQINSLAFLETNRALIPLILSLPSSMLSLTKEDKLKVRVTTVLGSNAPPLKVWLVRAVSSSSKDVPVIENQELKLDSDGLFYCLDALPKAIDVGNYVFVFEIKLEDTEHKSAFAAGGETEIPVYVTGVIRIENAEIAILDSDLGSVDMQKKLNLAGANAVSLSANHLQKLRLSFELSTPRGRPFKPHQAFLKLNHVTKVEHIFLMGNSGKRFEIILDFLSLVEKLFYLSGQYDIQLTVGDSVMENSFYSSLGHIELDLPDLPEKGPRPPAQPVDPYSRYGPQSEIEHIFRSPEKRPPVNLSLAFLGLSFLPFVGFLVGLLSLGVNLKGFPTSPIPASFGVLFQVGIASVLILYVLFWIKLDLFTTLKTLGLLGVLLVFVGHRILSHLASTSTKVKSA